MNENRKKNVILLILDSLRYDYLGYAGHYPSFSPTLDSLLRKGLTAKNGFAVGCPTMMSLPGIFTSTLPLDYGGYDDGIRNRKINISEIFQRSGYKTYGSFQGAYSFGLNKGVDCFHRGVPLIDLVTGGAHHLINNIVRYYIRRNKKLGSCIELMENIYENIFEDIKSYCIEKQHNDYADDAFIDYSNFYDYDRIIEMTYNERRNFLSNKKRYLKKSIRNRIVNLFTEKVFNINCHDNLLFKYIVNSDRKLEEEIKLNLSNINNYLKKRKVDLSVQRHEIDSFSRNLHHFFNWLDLHKELPFFAYLHVFDIHPPCNYIAYDAITDERDVLCEVNRVEAIYGQLKSIGCSEQEIRYCLSINYIDTHVKKLLDVLEQKNILDNTILVITSDHGTNFPGTPPRNNVHVTKDFYDEMYHVPISFINKEIKSAEITSLCSSIDIAPSILDTVGIQIPDSFLGRSIIPPNKYNDRDYVQMEHFGRGLCDYQVQPLTICIRSMFHKIVYQVDPPVGVRSGFVKEVYDLDNDPLEKHNIVRDKPSATIQELIQIAENRVVTLCRQNNI